MAGAMAGWAMLMANIALYGFLGWSIARFVRRRQAAYLLAAFTPFLWWGWSVAAGNLSRAQAERENVATAMVAPPAELPDTIVFEGKAAFPKPADIRKYFGFRYAIYVRTGAGRGQPTRTRILKYDLRDRSAMKPELLQALPERYVAFRAKDATRYWNDGKAKAAEGGPFEMHYVDAGRDSLIGLHYHRYVPVPMFPPVFALDGWSPASNSIAPKDLRALMLEFISSSLRRS
ncbi:MAG TPA: hypothetical protein VJ740_02520 [Hyphomicrobiaceae bacterium]|nr:hypothetical protein [Hyphomicrobiaceae bacterium]